MLERLADVRSSRGGRATISRMIEQSLSNRPPDFEVSPTRTADVKLSYLPREPRSVYF